MSEAGAPVAVPQTSTPALPPLAAPPARSGVGEAPPEHPATFDPALEGFHRIASERRERAGQAPDEVPFGSGTIRIYKTKPAGFAFDAIEAEIDPSAAKRMLRSAIYHADLSRFEEVMALPPDNPDGIDGEYLIGFLEQLGRYYGGSPLGA